MHLYFFVVCIFVFVYLFQLIVYLHRNHHQEASTGNRKGAIRDNWSRCHSSLRHQLGFKQDQVSHYHEHARQVSGNEDLRIMTLRMAVVAMIISIALAMLL